MKKGEKVKGWKDLNLKWELVMNDLYKSGEWGTEEERSATHFNEGLEACFALLMPLVEEELKKRNDLINELALKIKLLNELP